MADDPEWGLSLLAMVAFARGDKEALGQYLSRVPVSKGNPTLVMLQARGDSRKRAEKAIVTVEKMGIGYPRGFLKIARGELAMAQGQTARAIPLLEAGISSWGLGDYLPLFLGSESVAKAYEQQGDLPKATQVLEQASKKRAQVYPIPGFSGYFWIRIQLQPVQLYRKAGREEDARKLEDELLKLLAYADPDHPILLQLERSGTLRSAQPMK